MVFSLPSAILNNELLPSELIENLEKSLEEKNYRLIIEYATAAICTVKMSVVCLDLLDIRAHAYSVQGHLGYALENADQMIDYAPTLAAGYLRKGNLLSMYGRQNDAIRAYEDGITKLQGDEDGMDQLIVAKVAALSLNEQHVDFMTMLPLEVGRDIIIRLSQEAKSECAMVSKAWRSQVIECSDAWTDLTMTTEDKEKNYHLIGVTPYIAKHVKNLKINIKSEEMRPLIQRLNGEELLKLKDFELTAHSTRHLQSYADATLIFWKARFTLTKVKIDHALSKSQETVTLAQILSWCSSLTDLIYTTNFDMVTTAGDFSNLDTSHPVSNVEVEARKITGDDIDEMLKRCKQIRRVTINGGDETALDSINTHATNLQTLMYNASRTTAILKKEDFGVIPGLRKIDAKTTTVAAASRLLSLVYKNRKTLERVCLCLESVTEAQLEHLYTSYPHFRIENVAGLVAYRMPSIENLVLQWVRISTALTELSVGDVPDLSVLVAALMSIAPLKIFRLARVYVDPNTTGEPLIRLFNRYAKLSNTRQEVLGTVTLWNCEEVSDDVLDSLSNIKTLKDIHFGRLPMVTISGLSKFLKEARNRLTRVMFDAMNVVTNKVPEILAQSTTLKNVTFQSLRGIDGPGLRYMIDKLDHKLDTLSLIECSSVTEDVPYISNRVKKLTVENKT